MAFQLRACAAFAEDLTVSPSTHVRGLINVCNFRAIWYSFLDCVGTACMWCIYIERSWYTHIYIKKYQYYRPSSEAADTHTHTHTHTHTQTRKHTHERELPFGSN